MAELELKAIVREEKGGKVINRLRKSGWIPCELYGAKTKNMSLKVNGQEFVRFLHSLSSEHALINLSVGGKKENVMLKDIQYHPYRNEIIHIDFHKVSLHEKITVTVPVEETGTAKGVIAGGVVEHVMRELSIECLPKDIPPVIEIDITELEIGQSLHVSDITPPAGVKLLDDPKLVVISVAAPRMIAEEEVAKPEGEEAEASAAEPELIRKREKEEVEE